MYLKTGIMELRGISQKTSNKTGRSYNVANFEEYQTGEHNEVYLGDKFPELTSAKKGEHFILVFNKNKYNSLELVKFEKVAK